MVNKTVDFENRILDELRLGLHCTKKNVAGHFCTQKELADNLHMSLRDVRYWLNKRLVPEGKLTHETVTHNHKRKHKYTVVNPKQFTPKQVISHHKQHINHMLSGLEFLVDKMRSNPALYDVRLQREAWQPIPVYKKLPKKPKFSQTRRPVTLTSNVSKKGYEYLEDFCGKINEVFTFIDSISYSQLERKDTINNLRISSFDKIQKLIKRLVSGLTPLEKHAYYQVLLPRIPTIYQLNQIQKELNLKPF